MPTANIGVAIAGLTCFLVLDQTVSLRRNCNANSPRHRKAANRYAPF